MLAATCCDSKMPTSFASRRRSALALLAAAVLVGCSGDAPVAPPPTALCADQQVPVRQLAIGEAVVIGADAAACFALAGAGAEYVVAPQLTGSALVWAGYGFRLGAPSAAIAVARDLLAPDAEEVVPPDSWHGKLREREAALPRRPARPMRESARDVTAAAAPLERDFQVLSGLEANATFVTVRAALRFGGTDVLIYVDTAATAAFDAATLDGLGARLDALTSPIRAAFGDPTDVDGNGRVIFLLTPRVNALVPASSCAVTGFVRGFFLGDDLAGSSSANDGEIFYGYVPDPTGRWSCAHAASAVLADLPPTYVHELQHLISFGAHVVTRGAPAEEVWLNEGLSHLAEEIGSLYYENRFPAPAGRTQPSQLFPDSAAPYITPNVLASYRFLLSSTFYSLAGCAPGSFCGTAERSGVWLMLRWLSDVKGPQFTRQLVQSARSGRSNLEFAAGETFGAMLGDYAIAVINDSIVGRPRVPLPSRHRFTTRNLRQMYRAAFEAVGLAGGIGRPFPIEPTPLDPAIARFGTTRPWTFAHYSVKTDGVPATTLSFTSDDGRPFAPGAGAQVSVLRVR